MSRLNLLVLGVAVVLIAAACGDAEESDYRMTAGEYLGELNAIVVEFDEAAAVAASEDYPLQDQLIEATGTFAAYDHALRGLRAITPPELIAAEHGELVDAFDTMQTAAGDYLREAALKGDFTWVGLQTDPSVQRTVQRFSTACFHLGNALENQDADPPAGVCSEFLEE